VALSGRDRHQILSLTTLLDKEYNVSVLIEISEIVLLRRLRFKKIRRGGDFGSKKENPFS